MMLSRVNSYHFEGISVGYVGHQRKTARSKFARATAAANCTCNGFQDASINWLGARFLGVRQQQTGDVLVFVVLRLYFTTLTCKL